MMARSITVERSVPALPGLARVSGLGMGRHGKNLASGLASEVNLEESVSGLQT